jgi:predicted acetyltransferase
MTPEIRKLEQEEAIKALHFLNNYAFRPTPPFPDIEPFAERIRKREGAAYYAVMSEDAPLSIACSTSLFIQNLRGSLFRMGGVANVATHPAARRKGYVRDLMRHLYQTFKDQEIPVSCLYPFRESFYERLGYVTLPQPKKHIFKPESIRAVFNLALPGHVELVPFTEGLPTYRQILEALQPATHGMALFDNRELYAVEARETWLALARIDNETVGVMQYQLKEGMMEQILRATDFLYTCPEGKFLLLEWIARHIDQAATAEIWLRPDIFGETLFTDIRPSYEGVFLAPMARVVDVEGLKGMPVGTGQITLEIRDEDCPWNNDVWRFSAGEGRLALKPAEQPECWLSIHGLSAMVYGVGHPEEFALRSWGDPDQEQQIRLRQLFPAQTPFLHAMF